MRGLKMIFYFILIATILSCNSDDDENNQTNGLVGVWQRSDVSDIFENKFIFNSDNSGYRTWFEGNSPTSAISNAETFNWSTNDNQLTLIILNEKINTPFSFNSEGQLILSTFSDIPFNKLE